MKRVFVCSPLRGKDGQPSPTNIALARRLMKAVFEAGQAPFVPHLLYPQVLSEGKEDLKLAFEANITYLTSCDEIWVWARRIEECSGGMRVEIEGDGVRWRPRVQWMPAAFVKAEIEGWRAEVNGKEGCVPLGGQFVNASTAVAAPPFRVHGASGECAKCRRGPRELNRYGWCIECFSGGPA